MLAHPPHLPLMPPGLDFITEESLNRDEPIADTGRYFDPGVVTVLNGRKYVSLATVKLLAQVLGYELVPSGSKLCECPERDDSSPEPVTSGEVRRILEEVISRGILIEEAPEDTGRGDKAPTGKPVSAGG